MRREIDSSCDIIDSRDVIKRIDELEDDLQDYYQQYKEEFQDEYDTEFSDYEGDDLPEFEDWVKDKTLDFDDWLDEQISCDGKYGEEAEELKKLKELEDDCGSREWSYGLTLINENYFTEYAQEFAEDCGYVDRNASWPYTCIDWEQAAKELLYDYSSVDFYGVTFYYRD